MVYFESEWAGNGLELMAKDMRTQATSQNSIPTSQPAGSKKGLSGGGMGTISEMQVVFAYPLPSIPTYFQPIPIENQSNPIGIDPKSEKSALSWYGY